MRQTKKTVLVIDDDEQVLAATARQLRRAGWDVRDFSYPMYPGPRVDAALLDWLPYGEMMIRWCENAGVPVVVYTGVPDDVDVSVPILAKPASTDELVAALSDTTIGEPDGDLLAACEAALEQSQRLNRHNRAAGLTAEMEIRLRTAIAEARGES